MRILFLCDSNLFNVSLHSMAHGNVAITLNFKPFN